MSKRIYFDKAKFDIEGKDSYKFFQTGAEVIVTSPTRTTYFSHRHKELEELIKMVEDFDYLLVEGLKTLPLPRIGIFRGKIDESYFAYIDAIAIDESVDTSTIPANITILDLNNPKMIIDWIDKNAKEV